jgi:prevent-host-death family protein
METITASEFKAKCLAILDRVKSTGERIIITKRGTPVAEVVPPLETSSRFPQDDLRGTVDVRGDLVSPAMPEDEWEALAP